MFLSPKFLFIILKNGRGDVALHIPNALPINTNGGVGTSYSSTHKTTDSISVKDDATEQKSVDKLFLFQDTLIEGSQTNLRIKVLPFIAYLANTMLVGPGNNNYISMVFSNFLGIFQISTLKHSNIVCL